MNQLKKDRIKWDIFLKLHVTTTLNFLKNQYIINYFELIGRDI